jgi:undecaprenyl-diphosphatase
MRAISWIGYPPQTFIIVPIAAGLIFLAGLRWEAVITVLAAALVSLLNLLVKLTIQRPRPAADLVDVVRNLTSYSFPSGHVMFYVGFFGFLLFLSLTLFKKSWRRALLVLLLSVPIALVGLSRIYLGEHWASDVLGAYLLGSLSLAATVAVYRWGKTRFFARQPVAPHKGEDGT